MNTFVGIVIAAMSVLTLAVVLRAFIWAAKKDGEEDRAIQKRLGIATNSTRAVNINPSGWSRHGPRTATEIPLLNRPRPRENTRGRGRYRAPSWGVELRGRASGGLGRVTTG
jgi:hypothetical protein